MDDGQPVQKSRNIKVVLETTSITSLDPTISSFFKMHYCENKGNIFDCNLVKNSFPFKTYCIYLYKSLTIIARHVFYRCFVENDAFKQIEDIAWESSKVGAQTGNDP